MRNIKLVIEYDGTNYHGWQKQLNAVTVQDVLENSIEQLTGENCNVTGAGRTDTGVHAFGQAANFFTQSSIPAERFSNALNSILPDDIVVKTSQQVEPDFHSRHCAKGKKYRYLIYNSQSVSAIYRNLTCHIPDSLDLNNMKEAAGYFIGSHDFSAFRASGSSVVNCVRNIRHVSLEHKEDMIVFEIAGNGFLYNMVRIIAGTLIEIGMGKIHAKDIPSIIDSRCREKAGKTAPAQGLYLVEVYY